jgi:hypothetical protein
LDTAPNDESLRDEWGVRARLQRAAAQGNIEAAIKLFDADMQAGHIAQAVAGAAAFVANNGGAGRDEILGHLALSPYKMNAPLVAAMLGVPSDRVVHIPLVGPIVGRS